MNHHIRDRSLEHLHVVQQHLDKQAVGASKRRPRPLPNEESCSAACSLHLDRAIDRRLHLHAARRRFQELSQALLSQHSSWLRSFREQIGRASGQMASDGA
eukprot:360759-Chlamydomonas_euryale.AAC.3